MVKILILLSEALIAGSLLMMIGFGFRTLIGGRKNYIAIGSMALAFVVFLIAIAIANPDAYPAAAGNAVSKPEAAIVLTAVAMLGLTLAALVFSAIRGFFR